MKEIEDCGTSVFASGDMAEIDAYRTWSFTSFEHQRHRISYFSKMAGKKIAEKI
jgi:hypothetical protein